MNKPMTPYYVEPEDLSTTDRTRREDFTQRGIVHRPVYLAADVNVELTALRQQLAQMTDEVQHYREACASVGETDGHGWAETTKELRQHLATVSDRLDALEPEYTACQARAAHLEQQLAEAEKTMADAWVSMGEKVKRIEEVKDERDQFEKQLAAMTVERDKWKRWAIHRIPTHGTCCTCQRCGLDHDSCRCDLDEVCTQLEAAQAEIAHLKTANKDQRSKLDEHNISDVSMGWG